MSTAYTTTPLDTSVALSSVGMGTPDVGSRSIEEGTDGRLLIASSVEIFDLREQVQLMREQVLEAQEESRKARLVCQQVRKELHELVHAEATRETSETYCSIASLLSNTNSLVEKFALFEQYLRQKVSEEIAAQSASARSEAQRVADEAAGRVSDDIRSVLVSFKGELVRMDGRVTAVEEGQAVAAEKQQSAATRLTQQFQASLDRGIGELREGFEGVSLKVDSATSDTNTALRRLQGSVGAIATSVESLEERIGSAEGRISSAASATHAPQQQVSALAERVGAVALSVASLEEKVSSAEARATHRTKELSAIGERMDVIGGSVAGLDERVGAVEARAGATERSRQLGAVDERVGAVASSLAALEDRVSTAEGRATLAAAAQSRQMGAVDERLGVISASLSTLEERVGSAEGRVSAVAANQTRQMSALDDRFELMSSSVAASSASTAATEGLQAAINGLRRQLGAAEERMQDGLDDCRRLVTAEAVPIRRLAEEARQLAHAAASNPPPAPRPSTEEAALLASFVTAAALAAQLKRHGEELEARLRGEAHEASDRQLQLLTARVAKAEATAMSRHDAQQHMIDDLAATASPSGSLATSLAALVQRKVGEAQSALKETIAGALAERDALGDASSTKKLDAFERRMKAVAQQQSEAYEAALASGLSTVEADLKRYFAASGKDVTAKLAALGDRIDEADSKALALERRMGGRVDDVQRALTSKLNAAGEDDRAEAAAQHERHTKSIAALQSMVLGRLQRVEGRLFGREDGGGASDSDADDALLTAGSSAFTRLVARCAANEKALSGLREAVGESDAVSAAQLSAHAEQQRAALERALQCERAATRGMIASLFKVFRGSSSISSSGYWLCDYERTFKRGDTLATIMAMADRSGVLSSSSLVVFSANLSASSSLPSSSSAFKRRCAEGMARAYWSKWCDRAKGAVLGRAAKSASAAKATAALANEGMTRALEEASAAAAEAARAKRDAAKALDGSRLASGDAAKAVQTASEAAGELSALMLAMRGDLSTVQGDARDAKEAASKARSASRRAASEVGQLARRVDDMFGASSDGGSSGGPSSLHDDERALLASDPKMALSLAAQRLLAREPGGSFPSLLRAIVAFVLFVDTDQKRQDTDVDTLSNWVRLIDEEIRKVQRFLRPPFK